MHLCPIFNRTHNNSIDRKHVLVEGYNENSIFSMYVTP